MAQLLRKWIGVFRFADREPFVFGTVEVDVSKRADDVEQALRAGLASIVPGEPELVEMLPGYIGLHCDDGEREKLRKEGFFKNSQRRAG